MIECLQRWLGHQVGFGEQLERHADKHRFPMRMRPGDRPPVQRFANRPLNEELLQARGSLGKLGGPPAFRSTAHRYIGCPSGSGQVRHRCHPFDLLTQINCQGAHCTKRSEVQICLIPRGKAMFNKQTHPRTLAHHVEITYLVRAYGITRDQARRLISRIGSNKAKLGEAARILKARLPSRSVLKAPYPG